MVPTAPRYVLQADALFPSAECGEWRFVLTDQDAGQVIAASDSEPGFDQDRLALLALVRGLEAIPHPSRVTLLTPCRTIRDGLKEGLPSWKSNGWKWERFGRLVTIRDHDLWRRVDQALQIHQLLCRSWRLCTAGHSGFPTHHEPAFTREAAPREARNATPNQPTFAPRPAEANPTTYPREPAILVIRSSKKRNRLRFHQHHDSPQDYAHASAG